MLILELIKNSYDTKAAKDKIDFPLLTQRRYHFCVRQQRQNGYSDLKNSGCVTVHKSKS